MKLTAHQIIDETVAFYQNNPRSIGHNEDEEVRCLYNGPNGEKCAFSRCCTPESEFQEGESASSQMPDVKFLPQYEGHPGTFWNTLQSLHDVDYNWDDNNKLSEAGISQVILLKTIYQ